MLDWINLLTKVVVFSFSDFLILVCWLSLRWFIESLLAILWVIEAYCLVEVRENLIFENLVLS